MMSPRSLWRVLFVTLIIAGCARTPYTNRSQLILVSANEESKLGAEAYREVLSQEKVVRDGSLTRPVLDVGNRLARAADRPEFKWEFAVLDDRKQANAFALPGGKVAVYTGILPVAQTTKGLAVVLGHEIAHVLARHGAERMSQGLVTQAGGSLLGAVFGGGPTASAVMAAYGLGAQLGVLLPYGRTQESEADHIGLLLMARAGYDPREALAFWQRMEKASSGGGPPEFLSTHPTHGTRERQIQAWLPEALRYYDASARAPEERLASATRESVVLVRAFAR
jgi:predicted Zn-dependent protease